MSRLTDIDILLNKYQTICDGVACMDCPFNDEGCRLEKMLLESPIADVAPVKHGHWGNPDLSLAPYVYECSVCGDASRYFTNYCPNCGAKMDEVTE